MALNLSLLLVVVSAVLAVAFSSAAAGNPSLVGTMKFPNPAFLSFVNIIDDTSPVKNQLLATTFGVSQNFISLIPDVDKIYNQSSTSSNKDIANNSRKVGDNGEYLWPNMGEFIPRDVFSSTEKAAYCSGISDLNNCNLLVIPDGFLVPGHKTGGVHIQGIDTSSSSSSAILKSFNVAGEETNWFYHKANWFDVDADGLQDIIIARCNVDAAGKTKGELIWLKHPSDVSALGKPWAKSTLSEGPDIITMPIVGRDGNLYVISAEFFNEKLSVTSITPGKSPKINSYTIVDSSPGPSDDLKLADVDGDGVLELVMNTHANKNGMVYAYELPTNLLPGSQVSGGDWSRHTIATGFVTLIKGQNQASPGFFYPVSYLDKSRNLSSDNHSGRSYFVVAGDGSKSFHLLSPVDDASNPYAYKMEIIYATDGTVGTLAVGDINQDGVMDVIIPDYDNGFLYFYTFRDYNPSAETK